MHTRCVGQPVLNSDISAQAGTPDRSTLSLLTIFIFIPLFVVWGQSERRYVTIFKVGTCSYEAEFDATSWEVGKSFVNLFAEVYYPWQGEDTILYERVGGAILINEKPCGVILGNELPDMFAPDPEHVVIAVCDVSDIKELERYPNLRCVTVSGSDASLRQLSQFPSLEALNLIGDDKSLKYIAGLTSLRVLNLYHNLDIFDLPPTVDSVLAHRDEIEGSGLAYLYNLNKLRVLDLAFTEVPDANLIYLKPLTGLEELSLYSTPVTDAGLRHVADLTNLKVLDLGYTEVTNKGLEYISSLKKLEYLRLIETEVGDEGLLHISKLKNLKTLHLRGTQITEAGFDILGRMKNLKLITLYSPYITDEGINRLKRALPECEIVY